MRRRSGEQSGAGESSERQDEAFGGREVGLHRPATGVFAEALTQRQTCGRGGSEGESGKPTPMQAVQTVHPGLGRDGLRISQFSQLSQRLHFSQ